VLSPCTGFPALPVISSLIRGTLEFQHVQNFAVPLDCNRVRSSPAKDGVHVRVCFIPIYFVVALLFLICLVVIWSSSSGLVDLKEPFRLVRDLSQGRMSPIFVSAHSFSSCLSLSPPMNSRSLVASPCVEMAPMRYFQHLL
jgi:hypothetical protein